MGAEDLTPIDAEDHTPIDAEDHKPTQDAEVQTRDWEALAWEIKSEYIRVRDGVAEQVEELGQDLAPAVRHRALEVGLGAR